MTRQLYRVCSGQNRKPGAPSWGICLADGLYTFCQWWRASDKAGRQRCFRTYEQAEKARLLLEAAPMPDDLRAEMERQRAKRAKAPEAIPSVTPSRSIYWHHGCAGCDADGKGGLKNEYRV